MQLVLDLLVPGIIAGVSCYGMAKRVDVYDALLQGAAKGLEILLRILPALVTLLTVVAMLRASGALELAAELNLPVIIHAREATEDTLRILADFKGLPGVLHCFSGSAETAKIIAGWGFYVGFTGVLTFKNGRKPAEACAEVPIDRLLMETDCPYMAPEPWRGKRSCSPMIQSVAEKMAEIKGVTPQEMIDIAAENARRLFRV